LGNPVGYVVLEAQHLDRLHRAQHRCQGRNTSLDGVIPVLLPRLKMCRDVTSDAGAYCIPSR
jgi:hypothetical protein